MKLRFLYRRILFAALLLQTVMALAQVSNVNHPGSGPYSTISSAINNAATVPGDTLTIAAGTYSENVSITKKLTLIGAGTSTLINPSSGIGITLSSDSVKIANLRVANVPRWGIYASGRKGLMLTNVVCEGDSVGAELNSITGLTVTSSVFSRNNHHGFYSSSGQNFTFTDCVFNENGKTIGDGSGLKFYNLKGSSTFANSTVDSNRYHGMEIRSGCVHVTVNGGEFKKNGSSSTAGSDGGGIYIGSYGGTTIGSVIINGPLIASNNATAGIYADAHSSTADSINDLTIGQTDVISLTSNGISEGAGILFWGNIRNASVTANFSKGTISTSAGIIIVGSNSLGSSSPANVSITGSIFNAGYAPTTPAISLADAQPTPNYIGINGVTAAGNTFVGVLSSDIDAQVIYDSLDKSTLGRVTHTNDNPLPVELVSFGATVAGQNVHLVWSTAMEVNNYGFEVEKRAVSSEQSVASNWLKVGMVQGAGTSTILRNYFFEDGVTRAGRYAYRLKQIDNDGAFKYSQEMELEIGVPHNFRLFQNHPNPFNPTTIISYELPVTSNVSLTIFDLLGREVAMLVDGMKEAGYYTAVFSTSGGNGSPFASGLYFARFFAQPVDGEKYFKGVTKMMFTK